MAKATGLNRWVDLVMEKEISHFIFIKGHKAKTVYTLTPVAMISGSYSFLLVLVRYWILVKLKFTWTHWDVRESDENNISRKISLFASPSSRVDKCRSWLLRYHIRIIKVFSFRPSAVAWRGFPVRFPDSCSHQPWLPYHWILCGHLQSRYFPAQPQWPCIPYDLESMNMVDTGCCQALLLFNNEDPRKRLRQNISIRVMTNEFTWMDCEDLKLIFFLERSSIVFSGGNFTPQLFD